jgi:hypothetical protein
VITAREIHDSLGRPFTRHDGAEQRTDFSELCAGEALDGRTDLRGLSLVRPLDRRTAVEVEVHLGQVLRDVLP